jgi:hypothetical protein
VEVCGALSAPEPEADAEPRPCAVTLAPCPPLGCEADTTLVVDAALPRAPSSPLPVPPRCASAATDGVEAALPRPPPAPLPLPPLCASAVTVERPACVWAAPVTAAEPVPEPEPEPEAEPRPCDVTVVGSAWVGSAWLSACATVAVCAALPVAAAEAEPWPCAVTVAPCPPLGWA